MWSIEFNWKKCHNLLLLDFMDKLSDFRQTICGAVFNWTNQVYIDCL